MSERIEFEQRIAPHLKELRSHCYRLMGSAADADDLTQETMLRAWRHRDAFEGRSSLRTWLFRIATHACLDALERRPPRRLREGPPAQPGTPPPEATGAEHWLEPWPDAELGPEATLATRQS